MRAGTGEVASLVPSVLERISALHNVRLFPCKKIFLTSSKLHVRVLPSLPFLLNEGFLAAISEGSGNGEVRRGSDSLGYGAPW